MCQFNVKEGNDGKSLSPLTCAAGEILETFCDSGCPKVFQWGQDSCFVKTTSGEKISLEVISKVIRLYEMAFPEKSAMAH